MPNSPWAGWTEQAHYDTGLGDAISTGTNTWTLETFELEMNCYICLYREITAVPWQHDYENCNIFLFGDWMVDGPLYR